jgi:hypothetical protein
MIKWLWMVLPISLVWLFAYIPEHFDLAIASRIDYTTHTVIPSGWYSFPYVMTSILVIVLSIFFSIFTIVKDSK